MNEVVVTGLGVVSPIGTGTDDFWAGLISGRSGAGPISSFDASDLPVQIACEIDDFEATDFVPAKEAARTDRFTHLALAAASLAVEEAGFVDTGFDPARTGSIIGSGIGGLQTIVAEHLALIARGPRAVSPFMVPKLMPNGAAGQVAMRFGLLGPTYAVSSACASGAHAIGEAVRQIRHGTADVMLAGGTESAMTPLSVAAFARMGALSKRNDDPATASRPFDSGRDGFVFGEGAGILVLESRSSAERRGAEVLATVAGYGASCDASHVTQPDPEGKGAVRAMREALRDAELSSDAIDYINAHGTSTPMNDRIETLAIHDVFGVEAKRIPVTSTKSQTGHLLGAAGAVEAAATVLILNAGVVPQTINLETPDPDCDLDYVTDGPREQAMTYGLSNSFGFGGQNACLVFKAA